MIYYRKILTIVNSLFHQLVKVRLKSVVFKIAGILFFLSVVTIIVGQFGLKKLEDMNEINKEIQWCNSSTLQPLSDFLESLYAAENAANSAVRDGNQQAIQTLSRYMYETSGTIGNFHSSELFESKAPEFKKRWDPYWISIQDLCNELSINGPKINTFYIDFQQKSKTLYDYTSKLNIKN